jgi:hypothetical protein
MPAAYTFDLATGRYRDPAGALVAPAAVHAAAAALQSRTLDEVAVLSQRLADGDLSAAAWEAQMATTLRDAHLTATALAVGGWAQLPPYESDLIDRLTGEFEYLAGFRAALPDLSDAQQAARATLYAQGVWATYQQMRGALADQSGMDEERSVTDPAAASCAECDALEADDWVPLGTLPEVGERECLSNCRCGIEYRSTADQGVEELALAGAVAKYSDDQPRDDHGRWTDAGGGGSGGAAAETTPLWTPDPVPGREAAPRDDPAYAGHARALEQRIADAPAKEAAARAEAYLADHARQAHQMHLSVDLTGLPAAHAVPVAAEIARWMDAYPTVASSLESVTFLGARNFLAATDRGNGNSWASTQKGDILLNGKQLGPKSFAPNERHELEVTSGWAAAGLDGVRGIIAHELGHVTENHLLLHELIGLLPDGVKADHAALGKVTPSHTLSHYARSSPREAFAEAFAQRELAPRSQWDPYTHRLDALLTGHGGIGSWPSLTHLGRNVSRAYNPDEPRDERGRWTSGGEGSSDDGAAPAGADSAMSTGAHLATDPAKGADWDQRMEDHLGEWGGTQSEEVAAMLKAGVQQSLGDALATQFGGAHGGPFAGGISAHDFADVVVGSWATGSASEAALEVQRAAADQAGLQSALHTLPDRHWELAGQYHDALRAAVSSIYQATQTELRQAGITEAVLYRGMAIPNADLAPGFHGGTRDVHLSMTAEGRPLSSWTTDAATARAFAESVVAERQERHQPAHTAVVLQARFPARRIFSTPHNGPGCLKEKEVVVLGGAMRVRAHTAPVGDWRLDRAFEVSGVLQLDSDPLNADWLRTRTWDAWIHGHLVRTPAELTAFLIQTAAGPLPAFLRTPAARALPASLRAALGQPRAYNPDEPRLPAGGPGGGEWTSSGGGGEAALGTQPPGASLSEVVHHTEALIAHQPIEHLYAFDDQGRVVYYEAGDKHSVGQTGASNYEPRFQHATLLHNHPTVDNPGGSGLSEADVYTAIRHDAKAMIAVTTTHRYIAERPAAGWPDLAAFKQAVLSARGREEKKREVRYQALMQQPGADQTAAGTQRAWHESYRGFSAAILDNGAMRRFKIPNRVELR